MTCDPAAAADESMDTSTAEEPPTEPAPTKQTPDLDVCPPEVRPLRDARQQNAVQCPFVQWPVMITCVCVSFFRHDVIWYYGLFKAFWAASGSLSRLSEAGAILYET